MVDYSVVLSLHIHSYILCIVTINEAAYYLKYEQNISGFLRKHYQITDKLYVGCGDYRIVT
jgi:hypothetical protein